MADERSRIPTGEMARWLLVLVLLLTGIALYFRYAPHAQPIVIPTTQESTP